MGALNHGENRPRRVDDNSWVPLLTTVRSAPHSLRHPENCTERVHGTLGRDDCSEARSRRSATLYDQCTHREVGSPYLVPQVSNALDLATCLDPTGWVNRQISVRYIRIARHLAIGQRIDLQRLTLSHHHSLIPSTPGRAPTAEVRRPTLGVGKNEVAPCRKNAVELARFTRVCLALRTRHLLTNT